MAKSRPMLDLVLALAVGTEPVKRTELAKARKELIAGDRRAVLVCRNSPGMVSIGYFVGDTFTGLSEADTKALAGDSDVTEAVAEAVSVAVRAWEPWRPWAPTAALATIGEA